jgi:hypothetical protein
MTTITPGGADNAANWNRHNHGRGRGGALTTIGEAMPAEIGNLAETILATGAGAGALDDLAHGQAVRIGDALQSRERAQSPLLSQAQGHSDLRLAVRQAHKLISKMTLDGRTVGNDVKADAVAAGLHALTLWRAGKVADLATGAMSDDNGQTDIGQTARQVCWRAMVANVSTDNLGDSVPLHSIGDDWLYTASNLFCKSRQERAIRLRVERNLSWHKANKTLQKRFDAVATGRGTRSNSCLLWIHHK